MTNLKSKMALVFIFVALIDQFEAQSAPKRALLINRDVIGSEVMLAIIADQLLTEYEFSGRSPKTIMEKDYQSVENLQKEWRERNSHKWARNCIGLSMMDRKQHFADDQWVFAGNSSESMNELVYNDAFCSQTTKVYDRMYSKAIERSLSRIYPERNPDISPGDHLREKFNGRQLDRMIYEDCREINWGKSKVIRHLQLAGPGYETEPSQTRLESIASFCKCTLKEAKQIKDAYRLLELDFNTVREFNSQIRKRPADRHPMDVRITDWFSGKSYALGVGKFKKKESRTKYKTYTKQQMWEEYKRHFPETTAAQFNKEFPDGYTSLNKLMEEFLLPTLVENKIASLVEDGCKMNMVSYEMFAAAGESKNWNIKSVNADEMSYEEMDHDDLIDSFLDQEAYTETEQAFNFDQEYKELSLEELQDEINSDILIDERLAEIEELAIRPNKHIDVLPYTFWSSDMIKVDETWLGTKKQRALYEKSMKQLGKAKTIADLRKLKRDMGFNLTWPQFKKIEALMYKRAKYMKQDMSKKSA